MKMRTVLAIVTGTLVWGASAAQAQITVNLVPGNFTYQFADPTTGAPITTLDIPSVGAKQTVAVYLLQTGGNIQNTSGGTTTTYSNILQQLGAEGLGVRLVYNTPTGVAQVGPGGTTAAVTGAISPNTTAGFDFFQRDGSTSTPPSGAAATHTNDTTTNAQLTEGFVGNIPPAFPGTEDPLSNPLRLLIGKFTITGMAGGSVPVQAIDPFSVGNSNLTGPVPPTAPADGFHGEVQLDQYLSQYAAVPVIPTLTVNVVPEPGTMALCGLAGAGFAAWRRRQKKNATPTVAA